MKFYNREDAVTYFRSLLDQTRHDANSLALTSVGMMVAVGESVGDVATSLTDLKKAIELQTTIITASAMIAHQRKTSDTDIRVKPKVLV